MRLQVYLYRLRLRSLGSTKYTLIIFLHRGEEELCTTCDTTESAKWKNQF